MSAAALAVAALALTFAAACGGGEPAPPTATAQPFPTDSPLALVDGGQGGVTGRVVWLTPEALAAPGMERAGSVDLSRHLAFYVCLESDTVDLSGYDLERVSVLRDLEGGEYEPEAWLPWSVTSNYRDGLLLFRKVELEGAGVELVVRGLGGVTERSYRWPEPPGG